MPSLKKRRTPHSQPIPPSASLRSVVAASASKQRTTATQLIDSQQKKTHSQEPRRTIRTRQSARLEAELQQIQFTQLRTASVTSASELFERLNHCVDTLKQLVEQLRSKSEEDETVDDDTSLPSHIQSAISRLSTITLTDFESALDNTIVTQSQQVRQQKESVDEKNNVMDDTLNNLHSHSLFHITAHKSQLHSHTSPPTSLSSHSQSSTLLSNTPVSQISVGQSVVDTMKSEEHDEELQDEMIAEEGNEMDKENEHPQHSIHHPTYKPLTLTSAKSSNNQLQYNEEESDPSSPRTPRLSDYNLTTSTLSLISDFERKSQRKQLKASRRQSLFQTPTIIRHLPSLPCSNISVKQLQSDNKRLSCASQHSQSTISSSDLSIDSQLLQTPILQSAKHTSAIARGQLSSIRHGLTGIGKMNTRTPLNQISVHSVAIQDTNHQIFSTHKSHSTTLLQYSPSLMSVEPESPALPQFNSEELTADLSKHLNRLSIYETH